MSINLYGNFVGENVLGCPLIRDVGKHHPLYLKDLYSKKHSPEGLCFVISRALFFRLRADKGGYSRYGNQFRSVRSHQDFLLCHLQGASFAGW